jgi:hypothetical protein
MYLRCQDLDLELALKASLVDEKHGRVTRDVLKSQMRCAMELSKRDAQERASRIMDQRNVISVRVAALYTGAVIEWSHPFIRQDGPCQFDSIALQLYVEGGGGLSDWPKQRDKLSMAVRTRYGSVLC